MDAKPPAGAYLFEPDRRIAEMPAVVDGPPGLDPLALLRPAPLDAGHHGDTPGSPLRFTLHPQSDPSAGDLVGGIALLCTSEVREVLDREGIRTVDYYAAEVVHPVSRQTTGGFFLMHVRARIACLDRARSEVTPRPSGAGVNLGAFEIDWARAGDARLFRLDEQPTLVVIDPPLRRALQAADLGGVRLRATRVYDGF